MPVERLLTDVKVRNAKAQDKPCRLLDGGGLYLVVMPSGSKLWRFRYRVRATGKPTELTLGSYPTTDLAAARKFRDARRTEIEAGTDPSKARKETKRVAKIHAENTFGSVARAWLAMKRKGWRTDTHGDLIEGQIERYLFPALEDRPIADITGPAVLAVLRTIPSVLMQAKCREVASLIFRFAVAEERCQYDPAAAVKGALARHEGDTYPTIAPARLPHFLHALDHYGEQSPDFVSRTRQRISQIATLLAALTFVRPTELRLAEWTEVDFDAALWTVPGDRMKRVTKRRAGHGDHLVPLSRQALALLRELRDITKQVARGSPYVFPAHRDRKVPMYKHTIHGVLKSIGYGGKMSHHGFRHLASTMLNEAYDAEGNRRFDADVIERQLSHVSGGVRGVYNKAEYLPQRVKLMQAWADMLDAARARGDGGNVVPIGSKQRTAA